MREITLNGYIDDEVWFGDEITPDALHSLLYAEEKDHTEDVHIRLNSYGGNCNAAVRMHDDLMAYPGQVTVTVSGTAASAATVLCMAADHLEMTPGSLWMIHDPSIVAIGNVRDLKDAIHLLEACKESILNVYERRIKVTRDQAASMMAKTTWMDAQKALEDGFIDGILTVRQAVPADCIVPLADAEQKVQAWIDRHRPGPSARVEHITMKEGVLHEARKQAGETDGADAALVEENAKEPETAPEEPVSGETPSAAGHGSSEGYGTPISQLQKRLALIMPIEAQNKEKSV